MNRRAFLLSGAATLAATRVSLASSLDEDWSAAFARARQKNPWLLGFETAQAPVMQGKATIEGRWPEGLRGTFYRNGPAQHEIGGKRYHHWFDGDGMVQAFRMDGTGVHHRGRFVETEKYRAEQEAGRMLRPAFGTTFPGLDRIADPNQLNTANINVLPHAGRLLALWEGGEAHALDPDTLETQGRHSWSAETRGMPFTAHPRLEADGTLWGFGAAPWANALVLYRIGGDGVLKKAKVLPLPQAAMLHDFVVTERHIVFVLPSLVMNQHNAMSSTVSFVESHRFRADLPMAVLVIDKETFEVKRRAELPPGFIFHFGNGWEERDGTIRLDYVLHPDDSNVSRALRDIMRGDITGGIATEAKLLTLYPDGRTKIDALGDASEFPRVDPRFIGMRNRQLYAVASDARPIIHPRFDTLVRRDLNTGARDAWRYPATVQVEEHVFVPRSANAAEGDGWLIGTGLDFGRKVTQLAVFDARRVADGPLAVARLPYPIPLGFHGNFAPG